MKTEIFSDQAEHSLNTETELQSDASSLIKRLLSKPSSTLSSTSQEIHGVVVAQFVRTLGPTRIEIDLSAVGLGHCTARCMTALHEIQPGNDVAVMFEMGHPTKPMVIGSMHHATNSSAQVTLDGHSQNIMLEADHEIELRCGEAAIVLTADGRIMLHGTYISSHASGTQRILGGSVQIN
jgi:hypothetical protein